MAKFLGRADIEVEEEDAYRCETTAPLNGIDALSSGLVLVNCFRLNGVHRSDCQTNDPCFAKSREPSLLLTNNQLLSAYGVNLLESIGRAT